MFPAVMALTSARHCEGLLNSSLAPSNSFYKEKCGFP
jgi:hypothetical protein